VKAAKKCGKKAFINVDKLVVESKEYTVDTLQQLPKNLRPQYVATPSDNGFTFFFTEQSLLSNFSPASFKCDEKKYICSEQFLLEQKAVLFGDDTTAGKIMAAKDPYTIKRLSRDIKNIDDGKCKAQGPHMLKKGLLAKFSQNEEHKHFLLETGETTLVECNPSDKRWSCGLHMNDPNRCDRDKWKGENWLGQLLEDIRTSLS
jgi:ribA/ribD-fused uncharacterized protein